MERAVPEDRSSAAPKRQAQLETPQSVYPPRTLEVGLSRRPAQQPAETGENREPATARAVATPPTRRLRRAGRIPHTQQVRHTAGLAERSTVLGLVDFGDAYSPNASASHTYTNSAVFNSSSLASGPLELGMLESSATAGGFSSLQFTILEGSTTLLNDTFLTLASAQTFFNDNPFSLTLTAGEQSLTFELALTTDIPGSAFDTEFLFGVTPVPEPSTWGMIGVGGVALLGIMVHRRKRPRRTQLTG